MHRNNYWKLSNCWLSLLKLTPSSLARHFCVDSLSLDVITRAHCLVKILSSRSRKKVPFCAVCGPMENCAHHSQWNNRAKG